MSWFLFQLLGLTDFWLKLPPSQWDQDEDFLEMREFAHSVKLTIDVAERGVKLVADNADILTTDSEERKKLVLAVQAHRRLYKHMNKSDLVKRIGEKNTINIDEEDLPIMDIFEELSDVEDV